jgi:Tfp pilus assembly protein PilN
MIRINLLPEEYRKKAGTPIKMLVAIAGLVAVNAALLSWWGWTVFGIHAKVDSEKATLQLEMDGLAPQVTYYHSLETESKQYKSREKTLASITADRISWTRKLDELIDVANAGGDGSRHLVWLDDLNVTQATDANSKNFGSVRAAGHSGSDKFAQVANFLEDLETSAFIDDFDRPAPPEGTQTLVDETLVPPVAWAFPLSLSLKGPEDRAKSEAARLAKNYKANAAEDADTSSNKKDGAKPAPPAPSSGSAQPDSAGGQPGKPAPVQVEKKSKTPASDPAAKKTPSSTQGSSTESSTEHPPAPPPEGSGGSTPPNTGKPGTEERR